MKLSFQRIDALPPLAWIACCKDDRTEVLHGRQVETFQDGFVEGAWDGPFSERGFVDAEWFCGSGGKLSGDGIVFTSATHVISALYHFKSSGGGVLFSNSLYLLMAREGLSMDDGYLDYEADFATILKGVHDYKKTVHVLDRQGSPADVMCFYFREISVDRTGELRVRVKPSVRTFVSFGDYRERLFSAIRAFADNAADGGRKHRYQLVTTISSGYDAPCCAAVAKYAGCDTAVTFAAEGKYAEDSGKGIAQRLGYGTIIERSAQEYRKRKDLVEAPYLAAGELGPSISFSCFDEEFRGNAVFTGERGDSVWNCRATNRNGNFAVIAQNARLDSGEKRLWLGYIPVPMPLYGATAWESLYDIANSEEMASWRLSNNYDRPIPRRILEEAGVPREMFGTHKHGAGFFFRFDTLKRLKSRLSQASAASFEAFVRRQRRCRPGELLAYLWRARSYYGSYVLRRLGFRHKTLNEQASASVRNPMAPRYLIPWAGGVMLERYQAILKVR